MTNPVACYDIVFYATGEKGVEKDALVRFYTSIAKRWAFQLEAGTKNGTLHYQGRISLKTRARKSKLMLMAYNEFGFEPDYVEPTSAENAMNNFYVMKLETRQDGPWTDRDANFEIAPQYLEKYDIPFQNQIIKYISEPACDRTINYIYNKKGCAGKSFLINYLNCRKIIYVLPPIICNNAKEAVQYIMSLVRRDRQDQSMYQKTIPRIKNPSIFVDIPRSIGGTKLIDLFLILETMKSGHLFDTRYSGEEWYIPTPHVYVFTNAAPNLHHVSADRWTFWKIDLKQKLRLFKKYMNQIPDVIEKQAMESEDEDDN